MRYRHAHWWLAALLPLIVVAFWPGYFSQLRGASLGHHVHGAAGTLWIALAAWQSWTIAARRIGWHRAGGRMVYPVTALFAAGGSLAISEMAAGFVGDADPFRAAFGARLALLDLTAVIAFSLLVRDALRHRRRLPRHAASMLATVILVLPPMFGRLFQHVPGYPPGFPAGLYGGQLLGAAIAGALWWRDRRDGAAFLAVALLSLAHCVSFATYGGAGLAELLAIPAPLPLAALAAGLAVALVKLGDGAPTRAARPAPAL